MALESMDLELLQKRRKIRKVFEKEGKILTNAI